MIIYNVTINIEDNVCEEWIAWMQEIHIPDVMSRGIFTNYNFSKLLSRQEDETGTTYVIQYLCENMASYEKYRDEYAPALQAEMQKKFKGKFVAFRSLMEKV
jgi:hypothetical protein